MKKDRNLFPCFAVLNVICVVAFTGICASAQQETEEKPAPYMEVSDFSRGLKITTFSDNWSYSPLGKFGINMVHNPGFSTLNIRSAFTQNYSPEETLAKQLAVQKKNEKSEIISEKLTVRFGDLEAVGFSYSVLQRDGKEKKIFVYSWLKHGDRLFEIKHSAKDVEYDKFMKAADQVLRGVEFIETR